MRLRLVSFVRGLGNGVCGQVEGLGGYNRSGEDEGERRGGEQRGGGFLIGLKGG